MKGKKQVVGASAGKDMHFNRHCQNLDCPKKYLASLDNLSKKATDFADKSELHYFREFKKENIEYDNFGWDRLSLQEKYMMLKVISLPLLQVQGYASSIF